MMTLGVNYIVRGYLLQRALIVPSLDDTLTVLTICDHGPGRREPL